MTDMELADAFDALPRAGADVDIPEGARTVDLTDAMLEVLPKMLKGTQWVHSHPRPVQFSDTLAKSVAVFLRTRTRAKKLPAPYVCWSEQEVIDELED